MDKRITQSVLVWLIIMSQSSIAQEAHIHDTMIMSQPQSGATQEKHDHDAMMMSMHGMYGAYPMGRDSSGTSWQPDATPRVGIQFMKGDWMIMTEGWLAGIHDHQGGRRGDTQTISTSMFMVMAQTDVGIGTLGLRGMISLDPQMGPDGYPLLLQVGETANGKTELIDRQHPHDLFMELAASYSIPLSKDSSVFAYVALPGEPALGPPVFMHRWSGINIPEAPLTHHWLDSTHIIFGVATVGWIWKNMKLESSLFRGREPDQHRWNMESPKFDSNSFRVSYNPTENWALQISYGHLKSPEQLSPHVNTNRTTASAIYNYPLQNDDHWQTTLAWGQNANKPGHHLNGYLLESTRTLYRHHQFFGRAERLQEDELLSEVPMPSHQKLTVDKLSIGYSYLWHGIHHLQPELGTLISTYDLPIELRQVYGQNPFSYQLFARLRVGA
jgi:hypothetical protein